MLMELGYFDYAAGVQRQVGVQGWPIKGVMIFVSREDVESATYVTVRTPQTTLCERILLDDLHQLSDFWGGQGDDDGAASIGLTYLHLGLVALADNEELSINLDCQATPSGATKIGVAVVIDMLPQHGEVAYHYQQFTDSSFYCDAAAGLYLIGTSMSTSPLLANVKLGKDHYSTTLRATNWAANLLGKIKLDNSTLGVVFENAYGMPMSVNGGWTFSDGVRAIVRRVVQVDADRRELAASRLAAITARKVEDIDTQSLSAAVQ